MDLNKIYHINRIHVGGNHIPRDHPEKVVTNLIEMHYKIYEITPHPKV